MRDLMRYQTYRVPINSFLIDQDPHELGDGQGRVGVVQLYGDLLRHLGEVVPGDFQDTEL